MAALPRVTRRQVLRSLSVTGAGVSTGFFTGTSPRPARAANEQLQIACIGVANRASENVDGVSGQRIVALCDIDDTYIERLTKPRTVKERFTSLR